MNRKTVFWTAVMLTLLIGGTAFYLSPRLVPATPLSNASGEPRSLSDLVNFTKISNLKESALTPLNTDWESALATIQQYQGTAPVYSEACSKYSCPGGVPITLATTPQTLLPQKAAPSANDNFGYSVASVGTNLLIGVPSNKTSGLPGAGAAYQFDISGNLLRTYHEPTPSSGDNFGLSVAGVGGNILVGSPDTIVGGFGLAGAAYLFDSSGNLLHTYHEPTPSINDFFGLSVAGVGSNVLIGSYGTSNSAGAAYLFDTNGNLLTSYHEPTPAANDFFGYSVASAGGNILIGSYFTPLGGANGAGAAYLFDISGSLLHTYHEPTISAGDNFGFSVTGVGGNVMIGSRGTAVGGVSGAGAAYLFDSSGSLLRTYHEPTPAANDLFGASVAPAAGGNVLISSQATVGGFTNAGAAYLFDSNGNLLTTYHESTPGASDFFGLSVAASGSNVLIGSQGTSVGGFSAAGAAYLFDSIGNLLSTFQKVTRPLNGNFGLSVASVGSSLVVGAPQDSNSAGIVYVLDSSGTIVRTLRKPVPFANDNFGYSLTSVGSNILVGTPNNSSLNSLPGAAYLFDTSGNLLATLRKPGLAANDRFGFSLATVGNNILIGAPGNATAGLSVAGAAYLFDTSGNLLRTFHEPTPATSDQFGYSVAGVAGNILISSPYNKTGGFANAGAAYLFDSIGNLLATYHEPTPAANDFFGVSVAGAGSNILVGSLASSSAGAAYLFDTSGNLLKTFHEPTPAANDRFGCCLASVSGSILIGSIGTTMGGFANAGAAYLFDSSGGLLRSFQESVPAANDYFGRAVAGVAGSILIGAMGTGSSGAAYFYRQFGLRDSCAAATGNDCVVISTTGTFQAGPNTVAMNVVAVSLRSARNATLGTQMALTVMCNKEVTTANIACSALYVDGNVWGPLRDALTKSPFIIVNAEPYFYLAFHWWDPANQRIFAWSYWWYGTNVNPNWYWEIYLSWRSYVATNVGAWTPYWWYFWYWIYLQYWSFWTASVPP